MVWCGVVWCGVVWRGVATTTLIHRGHTQQCGCGRQVLVAQCRKPHPRGPHQGLHSGGSWWFVVVTGGFWWFVVVRVVCGGCWWFVVVAGGSWWFLVVFGGLWWLLVVRGGCWWFVVVRVVHGGLWRSLVVGVVVCSSSLWCFVAKILPLLL